MDTFFLLASDPYNYKGISGKDNILSDELGKKIQNVILQRLEPRQKILTKALEAAETDLTEAVIKLPGGSQKEAGQSIRGVIDTLYQDFDKLYDEVVDYLSNKEMMASLCFREFSCRLLIFGSVASCKYLSP